MSNTASNNNDAAWENEKRRMKVSDRWVVQIMRPILFTGVVEKMLSMSRMLEADGDMEWLEDAVQHDKECGGCDGECKIECIPCNGTGESKDGEEYECPDCKGHGDTECEECEGEGRIDLGQVLEYWIVSDRASSRLRDAGESIIMGSDLGLGADVWCRRTTGQAVHIDEVVMDCAEAFAKDNDWWVELGMEQGS